MNGTPHDLARLSPQALEALEETLGAYALGALPTLEADAVTAHLADCPACRTVTADFAATAGLLAVAPEPVEPSAGLRHRILAAAQDELDSGAPPAEPIPFPGPLAQPSAARRTVSHFPWVAVAAALLVSFSVGVWNNQLRGELREQGEVLEVYEHARQTWALAPTAAGGGRGRGLVAVLEGGGQPVVLLQDLPAQPPNRIYQVWVIRNGQPVSAAVVRPGPEPQQRVELQQDLTGVQTIAVSVEPAGGSPSPTGPIVLAGNL
jgi:anti-sigma factor RsiW